MQVRTDGTSEANAPPVSGVERSFHVALERYVALADDDRLRSVDRLLTIVLHCAIEAMGPSMSVLTGRATVDGTVTSEGVRVRHGILAETDETWLVLERNGVEIAISTALASASSVRGLYVDADGYFDLRDGAAARSRATSPLDPRVQWLSVHLVEQADQGPHWRSLYGLGERHEGCSSFGLFGHEFSRLATVTDVSLKFAPFEMLRSALDAHGLLDAVRERSAEIGRRPSGVRPWDEVQALLTGLGQAIALLDGGIPGHGMMRHVMYVYAAAAAGRLGGEVASLPNLIDSLVTGGHTSMRTAFTNLGTHAHVVPSHRGAILHVECVGYRYELVVDFDGEGDVGRLSLSRSYCPHPSWPWRSDPLPTAHDAHEMGTYSVRGGVLTPVDPLPDDLCLPEQVNRLKELLLSVIRAMARRASVDLRGTRSTAAA